MKHGSRTKKENEGIIHFRWIVLVSVLACLLLAQTAVAERLTSGPINFTITVSDGAGIYSSGPINFTTYINDIGGYSASGNINFYLGIPYQQTNVTITNTSLNILQSVSSGTITGAWNDATQLIYGTYTMKFNNTDWRLGENNYNLNFDIFSDWTKVNETNRYVNFTAAEVKSFTINSSSPRPYASDITGPTLDPTSPSNTRIYNLLFTLNINSTEVSAYNITVPIPKSILTEYSDALTHTEILDSSVSDLTKTYDATYVYFTVNQSRNIAKGDHSATFRYYVITGTAGTGGSGGDGGVTVSTTTIETFLSFVSPLRFSIVQPKEIGPKTLQDAVPNGTFFNTVQIQNEEQYPIDFEIRWGCQNTTKCMDSWCSFSNFTEKPKLSVASKGFLEFRVDCDIPSTAEFGQTYKALMVVTGCSANQTPKVCYNKTLPAKTTVGVSGATAILAESKNTLLKPILWCQQKKDCDGLCMGGEGEIVKMGLVEFSCFRLWMPSFLIFAFIAYIGVYSYWSDKAGRKTTHLIIGFMSFILTGYILYAIL